MFEFLAHSKEQIQNIIDENGGVAILDFFSKNCSDCGKLESYLNELDNEKKIPLIKIDVDEAKELCKCYKIEGIPSFAIAKENWHYVTECKECHETEEILEIFNTAVKVRDNLQHFQ